MSLADSVRTRIAEKLGVFERDDTEELVNRATVDKTPHIVSNVGYRQVLCPQAMECLVNDGYCEFTVSSYNANFETVKTRVASFWNFHKFDCTFSNIQESVEERIIINGRNIEKSRYSLRIRISLAEEQSD